MMAATAVLALPAASRAQCPVEPGSMVVQEVRPAYRPLGTFYPQPYTYVAGNGLARSAMTPMGLQSAGSLAEYGPLSINRRITIPVETYSRGYDGTLVASPGVTTVYPNLRNANPANGRAAIAFPPARGVYRPFRSGPDTINWIDQN
jgi:hypothetical protein